MCKDASTSLELEALNAKMAAMNAEVASAPQLTDGALSNVLSNVVSNVLSNVVSNVLSNVVSNVLSNVLSNVVSNVLPNAHRRSCTEHALARLHAACIRFCSRLRRHVLLCIVSACIERSWLLKGANEALELEAKMAAMNAEVARGRTPERRAHARTHACEHAHWRAHARNGAWSRLLGYCCSQFQ